MELAPAGRLLAACIVVAAVLYLLRLLGRFAMRAAATSRPGGRIVAILETTALPNNAALHVVRIAERYFVLGRSAAHVTLLYELPPGTAVGAAAVTRGAAASPGPSG